MFDFDTQHRTPREDAEAAIGSLEAWHAKVIRHWADGARGWAPEAASEILSRSRLDRQASLCSCLRLWLDAPADSQRDGQLVLAWANLGSLVEGSMKFFLSVFANDYANGSPIQRRGRALDPDELGFDQLRQFFNRDVWLPDQRTWDTWLEAVQRRRNAIHAYRDREVGTHGEFVSAIVGFREFAEVLDGQVPWFDGDDAG
jgi:hypothetical protein